MNINISDEEWFEINLNPELGEQSLGFSLPTLPPDELQQGFTGRAGRNNLKQAFSFYQYIRDNWVPQSKNNPVIMDFGAGWGRIIRFFLKDTTVENLWAVDPYSLAVDWMQRTNLPCNIVHSKPLPPIPHLSETKFDVIYSYSVFSHLNHEYFRSWIAYLINLLDKDGVLIFTTRGSSFINYVEKLIETKPDWSKRAVFQNIAHLRESYANGEFMFFRDRESSGELSGDFYGEAFIPKQYIEREMSSHFLSFTEQVPHVDQAVIVLKP